MKIRNGFVSNSSSSSFIIAFKGDVKEQLEKALGLQLKDNYPIPELLGLSEFFRKNIDSIYLNYNEFSDDAGYCPIDDDELIKFFDQGFSVATGGFADDYSGLASFLCSTDFNYKSDNLIILQQGGY
jgi:hypothetical protein